MGDYTHRLDKPCIGVYASDEGSRWRWYVGVWAHRSSGRLWEPYIAQGRAATRRGAMRKARRALSRHEAFLRRQQRNFSVATPEAQQ